MTTTFSQFQEAAKCRDNTTNRAAFEQFLPCLEAGTMTLADVVKFTKGRLNNDHSDEEQAVMDACDKEIERLQNLKELFKAKENVIQGKMARLEEDDLDSWAAHSVEWLDGYYALRIARANRERLDAHIRAQKALKAKAKNGLLDLKPSTSKEEAKEAEDTAA